VARSAIPVAVAPQSALALSEVAAPLKSYCTAVCISAVRFDQTVVGACTSWFISRGQMVKPGNGAGSRVW